VWLVDVVESEKLDVVYCGKSVDLIMGVSQVMGQVV
jgi:hypothetical protein